MSKENLVDSSVRSEESRRPGMLDLVDVSEDTEFCNTRRFDVDVFNRLVAYMSVGICSVSDNFFSDGNL